MNEEDIHYRKIQSVLVLSHRTSIIDRDALKSQIKELLATIPSPNIAGNVITTFNFITDIKDAFDVEIAVPIHEPIKETKYQVKNMDPYECLEYNHEGSKEERSHNFQQVFAFANAHGIISDEFYREIYLDDINPNGSKMILQFIIHNWDQLLSKNLERVLGPEKQKDLLEEHEKLNLISLVSDRFQWVSAFMNKLDQIATENECYDILSGCAHVFPKDLIHKAHLVYKNEKNISGDTLKAIDTTLAYMDASAGWGQVPFRKDFTLHTTKNPRDQAAFEKATTQKERIEAYCYCPIIRNYLDQGMSPTFCNCGAGWVKQQWEGILKLPLQIELVHSLLKGDEKCEFMIHIPEDL